MSKTSTFFPKLSLAACMNLALLAGGLATLSTAGADEEEDAVTVAEQPEELPPMNVNEQAEFSRLELATRLEIELDSISVSGVIPVRWRSTALGCPKPDTSYDEMLIPGVLIMLRVDNTAYRYHSLPGKQPFYCPPERVNPQYVGPDDA
jgi:hypothetical protein